MTSFKKCFHYPKSKAHRLVTGIFICWQSKGRKDTNSKNTSGLLSSFQLRPCPQPILFSGTQNGINYNNNHSVPSRNNYWRQQFQLCTPALKAELKETNKTQKLSLSSLCLLFHTSTTLFQHYPASCWEMRLDRNAAIAEQKKPTQTQRHEKTTTHCHSWHWQPGASRSDAITSSQGEGTDKESLAEANEWLQNSSS